MVDQITLQTIGILLTGISLTVAAAYYTLTLRNQSETRQAQLFMQLFQLFINKDWVSDNWKLMAMEWKDLPDFYSKYDSSVDVDNFAMRFRAWFFLDGMGLLMKKGLVDKEMVYHLMGGYWGIWIWEKFKDVIKHQREYQNLPEFCVWFEYLSKEMEKMRAQRGFTSDVPETWGAVKLAQS